MLVAALLLALVFTAIDVHAAWRLIGDSDPLWALAGLALVQVQVIGSALRWRLTARALGTALPLSRVIAEYYLATLVNQTLPGGVTGDAARAIRNRGTTASVVLERLAGQLALALFTLVGIVAWPLASDAPLPGVARVLVWVFGALALTALLVIAWQRRVRRRTDGLLADRAGPRASRSTALMDSVRRAWWADGAWWRQGLLSLCIAAAYLALFAVAARAIGAPLPPLAVLNVVPLVLFSMLLPVSIGGWGLREAAAAALWPLVGLTSEAGVATSILYGLLSLAGSLPALWWLLRRA